MGEYPQLQIRNQLSRQVTIMPSVDLLLKRARKQFEQRTHKPVKKHAAQNMAYGAVSPPRLDSGAGANQTQDTATETEPSAPIEMGT